MAEKIIAMIKVPGALQAHVVREYRDCIFAANVLGDDIDFATINRAIISKWSLSGLRRIKEAAWRWSFE